MATAKRKSGARPLPAPAPRRLKPVPLDPWVLWVQHHKGTPPGAYFLESVKGGTDAEKAEALCKNFDTVQQLQAYYIGKLVATLRDYPEFSKSPLSIEVFWARFVREAKK